MEVSLSIESFPLADSTVGDLQKLLAQLPQVYETIFHKPSWQMTEARGFTVLAYTDEGKLIGAAAALDLVGMHQYEWTVCVDPEVRRQSIGSALVDGIQYGLQQRQAEGELAAGLKDEGTAAFLESLGYVSDFEEIMLGAKRLEHSDLPADLKVAPYNGQKEELEALLTGAFDEEVIPVIAYNIEEAGRDVWTMEKQGTMLAAAAIVEEDSAIWVTAFAVHPKEQGKGYGQAFLKWCRHYAFSKGKQQVLLDVDTSNNALRVYEKAGFQPLQVVEYWRRSES
ncbi:GNAT family N-acetyltransferase [Planococcus salinus]|uniref:GNAT family N-acetyltransferase n=1 Tax=Planococcus salinus TaxID=1848460 RepID=A0A3M8P9J6_9BACL|nr:GNAT family N-acetyltransferase [Planococcus salinus]RNF40101.1 GNAT family N-acetyltransferase [Planococcus salinus]